MKLIIKLLIIASVFVFNTAKATDIIWKSKIPIGEVGKVLVRKELIYVSDLQQTKILVFNEKGNLKKEVGKRGEGPDEISRIDDFDIWNNEIFIKESGFKIKNFDMNGKEIKSLDLSKFGIYFNKFFILDKEKFLLIGIDIFQTQKEVEKNKYNIFHIIDLKKGKKESFGAPLKGLKNKKYPFHTILLIELNFVKYDKDIYFYDVFDYKIFKMNLDQRLQRRLVSEKVAYFKPLGGDLEVYAKGEVTTVATNLRIPELRVFCEGKRLFVFLKTVKQLWLREYYQADNKYYFQNEKNLPDIENVYYFEKGIFYGMDRDYNLVAFKLH